MGCARDPGGLAGRRGDQSFVRRLTDLEDGEAVEPDRLEEDDPRDLTAPDERPAAAPPVRGAL
jgi:hypothetical protein